MSLSGIPSSSSAISRNLNWIRMKAYLIVNISSKGLTQIRRRFKSSRVLRRKSAFFHRAFVEELFLGVLWWEFGWEFMAVINKLFGPWHIKLESKILRQFEKEILTVWGSLDFRIFWKFIGDGLLSNYKFMRNP